MTLRGGTQGRQNEPQTSQGLILFLENGKLVARRKLK